VVIGTAQVFDLKLGIGRPSRDLIVTLLLGIVCRSGAFRAR
jgi:hypothetical protein